MSIPNYRNQIKIVFFDIDETLIVKDKDYLPESVLPAIRQLLANNIIPAIATGRSPFNFPPKIKALIAESGINLFVTMNGQYVSHQDKILAKYPISKEKIVKIVDFFDRHKIDYGFVSNQSVRVSNITEKVRTAMDPLRAEYYIDKDYFKNHEIFQILPFYEQDQDDLIAQSGILDGLKVVRWHQNSVDLFDEKGSKARGINAAIQYLDLNMDNVMAFGDGLNDLEMLSTVGVGVAMGNAHEKLKAIATHVTDHIENDGIYNFLHKAGLI